MPYVKKIRLLKPSSPHFNLDFFFFATLSFLKKITNASQVIFRPNLTKVILRIFDLQNHLSITANQKLPNRK